MDERHVQLFAGLFADPPVATDHHDLVTGVEKLVRDGGEVVPPLVVQRVEDVPSNLVEAVVEPTVRQALSLMPLDLPVHVAEHRIQIAARKRIV